MGNFIVKEEYTDEIKKLEPTTPGHADYFNEIYQKLINNDAFIKSITEKQAEMLQTHTDDENNPHMVTKAQVGLGNVPNVNTNDQAPTFTESTELNHLISGEKLSVTFSKIAKAITTLINHVGNKNNPHTVTKSQIGLGNVSNVSTNDQTPTFMQATTRSNLVSGEKISVSLGKVMKWFSDLKTGAFMTVVNNDITTAEGYIADARIIKAHKDEINNISSALGIHKTSGDHDGRYYTETEVNNLLSVKANSNHTHNYLPSTGGTINGNLELTGGMSSDNYYTKTPNVTLSIVASNFINLRANTSIQARNYSDSAWVGVSALGFYNQSSKRYKDHILDMPEETAKEILKLRPVTYDYKNINDGTNCLGLIAEEVVEIEKYPVSYNAEGEVDGLDYSKFVPQLIKMIQIQQKEIDELKKVNEIIFKELCDNIS